MNHYINFKPSVLQKGLAAQEARINQMINHDLAWLYLPDASKESRTHLRKCLQTYEALNTIIVSPDIAVGELAWKTNAYHFLWTENHEVFPYYTALLERLTQKIEFKPMSRKVKIKFQGGIDVFGVENICYAVADGNYTVIYLDNGIKKTVTMKLKDLDQNLQNLPHFKRIGKSFIVNIDKIKRIRNNKAEFDTDKGLKLVLSPLYKKRLVKELLWY